MKKGFTLIELLVVIAIIGILAGIVLTSLSSARNKAKDASVKSSMSSMRSAMETYFAINGAYKTTAGVNTAINMCDGSGASNSGFVDTSTNMAGLIGYVKGIVGVSNIDCAIGSGSQAWSVAAKLPGGDIFCVDANGSARSVNSAGKKYTQLNDNGTPDAGTTYSAHASKADNSVVGNYCL